MTEEDDEGEPQVRIYAREDVPFGGEALIVFFKEDSMTLALNPMDESSTSQVLHEHQQGTGGQGEREKGRE